MILGGVLRQFGGDVFGRLQRPQDFIGALDRLFGDLVAEGTSPEAFRAALESRPDRDAFERERDGELQLIYEEYLKRLADEEPARRHGTRCSTAHGPSPPIPPRLADRLGGRREIRLFGLQDLRGGWRALLRALAESGALDRIVIYTAEELELGLDPAPRGDAAGGAERHRLPALVSASPCIPERAQSRRPGSAASPPISAPDVERELDAVAQRVRRLADGGVPLHRIAVIARQARPYVDLALAALDRFGVPATARRRISWSEIPVIRAVRSLLAAAAEGWTRHGLAELAEQPYFRDTSSTSGW